MMPEPLWTTREGLVLAVYDNEPAGMPPVFMPHPSREAEDLEFITENPRFILFMAKESEILHLIGEGLVWF